MSLNKMRIPENTLRDLEDDGKSEIDLKRGLARE